MSHVSGWCCAPEGFRPQCERCKVPACAHGCHESSSRAGDCDVREGAGRETIGAQVKTAPAGALTPDAGASPTIKESTR